ncbi:MAG: type 3 dihydrofolate reductase [Pseudomonadales bacterium]|nr:type 3 dihydrofolate reductase [Pseudomonadales bacterium]MCP5357918.1 type 3 dihydrofolate reductase [Pseudomonadales bacterium]
MKLALIWAMARNRTIGRNNALPWHLSEDLKYFKRVTMGKPVIMGRKTWDSIGRPLPGRTNIVITRDSAFRAEGAKVVNTLEQALSVAESVGIIDGSEEVVVMGGEQIYALALPKADRLYMTEVHADVDGDAHFPEFDRTQWQELARENHAAAGPNPYDYSFVILERKV